MLVAGCFLLLASPFVVGEESLDRRTIAWQAPLEANVSSLVYVHLAWRHGDRTPAAPVPFCNESSWTEGLGELTRKGIAQTYRLGKWLRTRYGSWLGENFDRNEVYVRSSDYNRTLMSALANMAGLFPPSKLEMWDPLLAWQPVPIHSLPRSADKELYEDINCPTAAAEFKTVWKSGVVSKLEKDNQDLIDYLRKHSQMPSFQFYQLWMIYDNLFCMLQHNDTHKWPGWMNATLFSRLQTLYDASSRMKYHTEILRRLRGGPLLKDIIDRFIAKRNGVLGEKPKLYAYSAWFGIERLILHFNVMRFVLLYRRKHFYTPFAQFAMFFNDLHLIQYGVHDTTLAAMLSTLGIYPEDFPKYATAVLLELHQRDGEFVVEVYHKNMTDKDEVYRYEIPGCPSPCTLDALKATVHKYLPVDWKSECGLDGLDAVPYMISTAVFACTTALLGGFLALDVVLKRKRRTTFAADPLMNDIDEELES